MSAPSPPPATASSYRCSPRGTAARLFRPRPAWTKDYRTRRQPPISDSTYATGTRQQLACQGGQSFLYRCQRSLRLSVRTSDFQSEKTGSTPVGSATTPEKIRTPSCPQRLLQEARIILFRGSKRRHCTKYKVARRLRAAAVDHDPLRTSTPPTQAHHRRMNSPRN